MTLKQLEYIVTAAKLGNITEAANKLFLSQPSLTHAILELEKEMGITIFNRKNKGITVTKEGEEFLGYARQVLEQANLLTERYTAISNRKPRFCVSCQHYSFAVNAFVDVIKEYDSNQYDFILRETQTNEIISDVANLKSEIGIIYLSKENSDVLTKLFKKNDLIFEELIKTTPHVFIANSHPLAKKDKLSLKDLEDYPYLSYEQGDYNSFYYSEELLSSIDRKKNIMVRDRATLFNLAVGLNGYTVCSGIISKELNGGNIISKPLISDEYMSIGTLRKKGLVSSIYGEAYLSAIRKYI